MGTADSAIPSWITKWLYFTTAVCFFDGTFCILRPWVIPSFKEGGFLGAIYYVYSIYIEVDKNYGNAADNFVTTMGIGNMIEVAINIAVLLHLIQNIRWEKMAVIVCSIMTSYKTFMFFLYSYDPAVGGRHIEYWYSEFTMMVLPNILWMAAPAYAAFVLIKDFVEDKSEDTDTSIDETDSSFARKRYNLRPSKDSKQS